LPAAAAITIYEPETQGSIQPLVQDFRVMALEDVDGATFDPQGGQASVAAPRRPRPGGGGGGGS
jgi:hypothetical protein